jgi:hypothetical protein
MCSCNLDQHQRDAETVDASNMVAIGAARRGIRFNPVPRSRNRLFGSAPAGLGRGRGRPALGGVGWSGTPPPFERYSAPRVPMYRPTELRSICSSSLPSLPAKRASGLQTPA